MMKRIAQTLLPLLALASCSSSSSGAFTPTGVVFSFSDDPQFIYMTRNGDNCWKTDANRTYDDVVRPLVLEDLNYKVDHGEGVCILMYQDSCHTCQTAHDDIVHLLLDSGIEVFGVHFASGNFEEIRSILATFAAEHPALRNVFNGEYYTPAIYFVKNAEQAYQVSFLDHRNSLQELEEFFKQIMNVTSVYSFRTWSSFQWFAATTSCLLCTDPNVGTDPYFHEKIYPLAKHSPLPVAHLETRFFSDVDHNELMAYIGSLGAPIVATVEKGGALMETAYVDIEPDKADRLISSYFQVTL